MLFREQKGLLLHPLFLRIFKCTMAFVFAKQKPILNGEGIT